MKMLVDMFSNKDKKDGHDDGEEVGKHTKLKVVAALLIVGFAVYVAWWVQEPVGVKADLMETASLEETEESLSLLTQGETEAVTQEVSIEAFTFVPEEITVEKGTTVMWVNRDTVPHTVTGESASGGSYDSFSSGTLDSGQSYSRTFKNDGTYEYYCSFYPQMKGTVIVGTGVGDFEAEMEEELFAPTEETEIPTFEDLLTDTSAEEMDLPAETVSVNITADDFSAQVATESITGDPHGAAVESDELASSGPEDFLYLGAFVVILYLQRRRLFPAA